MAAPQDQAALLFTVQTLNAQNAHLVAELGRRLTSPEGQRLRAEIQSYYDQLGLGADDLRDGRSGDGGFDVDPAGARAFVEVLGWHPGRGDERPLPVGLDVFGGDVGDGALFDLRREASRLLVMGALAIGDRQDPDSRLVHSLVQVTVGADAVNTLLRRGLLGNPNPLQDPPVDDLGSVLGRLKDFQLDTGALSCLIGIEHALGQFGQAADAARAQAETTFRVWATGITALVPNTGYGGSSVAINGAGFGASQPLGRSVKFPRAGNGCLDAPVAAWTDTTILVTVPEGVGDGHVGFVQRDPPELPAYQGNPAAGLELAGELEHCIGPAAGQIADRLVHWIPPISGPGCPSALASDANHFRGGPEITAVSPARAVQGDSVTVLGTLFAPADVVLLDGQVCATTPVNSTELSFEVPAIGGGKRDVQVRHSPNHLSNRLPLYVPPVIGASSIFRTRPGDWVSLSGSGFASGSRVRVNSQETVASVSGPNNLAFRVLRPPVVTAASKTGDTVTVQVVLPDGTTSNAITLVLDTYQIVVFGDSVIWGQGLEEPQKFTTLVRDRMLNELFGRIGVHLAAEDVVAHSGATIGRKPTSDPTELPALPGEVPTSYPTIYQQVQRWTSVPGNALAQGEVDLVLLNGGINDCNVRTILFPLTSTSSIKSMAALHCHDAMVELLNLVAATFPKAKIVVTGYYQMISHDSDTALLAAFLIAIGVALGQVNGAIIGGVLSIFAKNAIVTNSQTFANEANLQLQLAVDEVNVYRGGSPRIFLAVPAFGPKNAALAPDSWLWEIDVSSSGFTAQDPVAASREPACLAAAARTSVAICNVASIGHPNPRGAQAYFDAIEPFL
jgi:hypothetical protein